MRFTHRRDQWHEPVCQVYDCGKQIREDSSVPVCHACGLAIAREFKLAIFAEDRQERRQHDQAIQSKMPAEMRRAGREVVYYVQIGDYIKIGYTKHLRNRMRSLRVTNDALLAIEDGDRARETARHREFVGDRVHRRMENFHPSERLLAHIDGLGGRASLPSWARTPDTDSVSVHAKPRPNVVP